MRRILKCLALLLAIFVVQGSINCLFVDSLDVAYAAENEYEEIDLEELSTADYPYVAYLAKEKNITSSSSIKDSLENGYDELGCTCIYPFALSKDGGVKLSFTKDTYAILNVAIVNEQGEIIFEKRNIDAGYQSKSYVVTLPEGHYQLKIFAEPQALYSYEYYFTLASTQKTVEKSMASCTTYKAKPGLGEGTWKTSDSSIVSISQKSGKTCTFRAKNSGTATITFENSKGKYTYKIKVFKYKDDPFRAGYIDMDSVGGVEPVFFIVNNSNKTVKYINFNVTFYNAVGDKVFNEIGNYGNAKLRITGPLKPWHGEMYCWDPVFYNYSVEKIYVKQATITYMDGTQKTVSVKKAFNYSDKKFDERYYGVNL